MVHFNSNFIPRLLLWAGLASGFSVSAISLTGCSVQGKENRRDGHHNWEVSVGGTPSKPADDPSSGGAPIVNEQVPEGGATSGGGYVYGYEANPWFLGNVSKVKYCIDIDEDHFGISKSKADDSIQRAVAMWKKTFKNAPYFSHGEEPAGTLVIATQDFEQVSCAESTVDIRFQLGTLTKEQQKILKNPRQYVGVTVQEYYDEEQMRGRGFIYVAPETGDLRPEADDLANNFWRYDDQILLDIVLLHEMGHVFGLGHESSGFPMASTLCEDMVTNGSVAHIERFNTDLMVQAIFGVSSSRELIADLMDGLFHNFESKAWILASEISKHPGLLDSINLTNEDQVLFDVSYGDLKISTWKWEVNSDGQLQSTQKVRDLDLKFEKKDSDRIMTSSIDLRIPKKQKIMKVSPSSFSSEDTLTASYSKTGILWLENVKTTGYLVNSKGEKTFISLELKPNWESSFMPVAVNLVFNNEIIQLRQ